MPFSRLGLHDRLLRGVAHLGYTQPTPIQEATIPPALARQDVMACAMTGTGKTAAFVLPILQQLAEKQPGVTRALILTPTRELAAQIEGQVTVLGRHTRISSAAIFGGVAMPPQQRAFRRGVDVLVATPGRLLDHLRMPYARLDGVEVLVLDEADRMLDMGFLPDVRRILSRLPSGRQTLFFSATLPPAIRSLAREMLREPVTVDLARGGMTPATGISHSAYPVAGDRKAALLVELLKRGDIRSLLAFTRTKQRANRLADFLERNGVAAARIHGNRSQSQRNQALGGFKAGKFQVLVATDVAARGIDVTALSHVVSFDLPHCAEDYVHRAGRTARAEAKGDALLFVSPDEELHLRGIERAIGRRIPRLTLADFDYSTRTAEKLERPRGQRPPRQPAARQPAARRHGRHSFSPRSFETAGRVA